MIRRGSFRRRLVATLVLIVGLTAATLAAVAFAFVSISLRDQLVKTSTDQAQFNIAVLADERLSDHPTAGEFAQSGLAEAFQIRGGAETLVDFGTDDPFVAMAQSCGFVKTVGGFRAFHLDSKQAVIASAPVRCDAGATWLAGPLPTTWPDARYLLIFDGVGHELTSPGGQAMALDLIQFVLAKR